MQEGLEVQFEIKEGRAINIKPVIKRSEKESITIKSHLIGHGINLYDQFGNPILLKITIDSP